MSMDLEKKTFSTAPEYFLAGATIGIAKATKKASAAVAAHAPVLLDSDKVSPSQRWTAAILCPLPGCTALPQTVPKRVRKFLFI